jgi:hypothetical protein
LAKEVREREGISISQASISRILDKGNHRHVQFHKVLVSVPDNPVDGQKLFLTLVDEKLKFGGIKGRQKPLAIYYDRRRDGISV